MKRKMAIRIRRIVSFSLVFAIMLASTKIDTLAADANQATGIKQLEYPVSVTYDVETGKITYGADQNGNLSDASSYEIQYDECAISPLYDGIIGLDNRVQITNTTDSPYRNVCYIEAYFKDGFVCYGSGVLVYFDVLLTAGHCVYKSEHGGWATHVTVTPAKNGKDNNPLGSTYATHFTSNEGWTVNGDGKCDWAIVDLKKGFDTWQLFGYYNNYYDQLGTSVTAIGYPKDHQYYMYTDTNSITYASEYIFVVLCDFTDGESGGALIDVKSGYLIGIITSGAEVTPGEEYANYCTRITPDLCSRIKEHYD